MVWSKAVGPGGSIGGIEWGTASDVARIYVPISNSAHASWTLKSGQSVTGGFWTALNPSTGAVLWQTADPTSGALDASSMSVANGVVYAGSVSGYMYALNAATGAILWKYQSGGSVIDAPAIVNGMLYWGSGYEYPGGHSNNKLYAFSPQ